MIFGVVIGSPLKACGDRQGQHSGAGDIGVAGDIGICTVGCAGNAVCGIVYSGRAGGSVFEGRRRNVERRTLKGMISF